jgi:hypothetical protein
MPLFIMAAALVLGVRSSAQAEELCDPSFEGCRARLINLIRNERVGMDVPSGSWKTSAT